MAMRQVTEQVVGTPRVGNDVIEYILGEDRVGRLLEVIIKRSIELGERPENVQWFRSAVLDFLIFVTFSREAKMAYLTPRMIKGLKHIFEGYYAKLIAACYNRGARVLAELLIMHQDAFVMMFVETRMRGVYGRTQERLLQQLSVVRQETQVSREASGGILGALGKLIRGGR